MATEVVNSDNALPKQSLLRAILLYMVLSHWKFFSEQCAPGSSMLRIGGKLGEQIGKPWSATVGRHWNREFFG